MKKTMFQCKFCNYTSVKKWNVQAHEKRKHSTVNLVKNNEVSYKEIKVDVEEAQDTKRENPLLEILKNEANREIDYIKRRAQVKKESDLRIKRRETRKIIKDCCRRLTKVIKELEDPSIRRMSDWLSD